VSAGDLQGLDFQNNRDETIVINVTAGFSVSDQLGIRGDAGDAIIIRWDGNADAGDGYNGEVKFQSGGCINLQGDLGAANFVHVASKLNAPGACVPTARVHPRTRPRPAGRPPGTDRATHGNSSRIAGSRSA